MSIGQITLAQAAKVLFSAIWKGLIWVLAMMLTCYVVGVEWNWRILVVCVTSSFFDYMIYQPRDAASLPKKPQ